MTHADQNLIKTNGWNGTTGFSLISHLAGRITHGSISVIFPDGTSLQKTGTHEGPSATLHILDSKLLRELASGGALGFARAYMNGYWETPNLKTLLQLMLVNEDSLNQVFKVSRLLRWVYNLRHRLRANSRRGSKRNISFHYDLGNAFYGHWLDESMTYSSAIFTTEDDSLQQAQQNKYQRIIDKLDIRKSDHILEIGCGWGSFASYAAKHTGCRLTCLTLSHEQAAWAREHIELEGLSEQIEIRLQDYRDCTETFDKIVSIEMFEAVGEDNWPVFFAKMHSLLKPEGQALLQIITIDEKHFENYRMNADFIQTYIFPGGMLPSIEAFTNSALQGGFQMDEIYRFGKDYEKTLMLWDHSFIKAWPEIEALGFDSKFKRMWHYYLNYCASGFHSGRIDVAQFCLTRSNQMPA